MIVGKYAYYELYLLQPVNEVSKIEKQRSMNRNTKQNNGQESFASCFQKAIQRHAESKKHNVNGFDMVG